VLDLLLLVLLGVNINVCVVIVYNYDLATAREVVVLLLYYSLCPTCKMIVANLRIWVLLAQNSAVDIVLLIHVLGGLQHLLCIIWLYFMRCLLLLLRNDIGH